MKLKDVIHYYIGCEVRAFYEQTEKIETGYLTGIHGEYGVEIQFIIDGNAEESPEYVEFDKVKLVLRNIEDMSEDEREQLMSDCGITFKDNAAKMWQFEAWATSYLTKKSFNVFRLHPDEYVNAKILNVTQN